LRDAFEVGDERHDVAALVPRREIRPTAVVAVDLERAEPAIGAARIERDDFRADALASRRMRASTAGKAARAARLISARPIGPRIGRPDEGLASEAGFVLRSVGVRDFLSARFPALARGAGFRISGALI
jgi:hypothetical protein